MRGGSHVTVPVPGSTVGAQVLGEAAAALGAGCIALHLVAAASPGHGGRPVAVLLVAMAAACVPCVRGLWRRPTVRTWAMTGGMYAAMLAAHLLVLTGPQGGAAAARAHVHTGALTWSELAMWSGLGLAGVQVALAAAVLLVRTAQARPSLVSVVRRRRLGGGGREEGAAAV